MKFDSAWQALGYYYKQRYRLEAPASVRLAPRPGGRDPNQNRAEERLEPFLSLSLCLEVLRPGERKALERLLAHPHLSLAEVAARYRTQPRLLRRRRKQGLARLEAELKRRGLK